MANIVLDNNRVPVIAGVSNADGSLKYTFENVAKFYAGRYARHNPTEFIALNNGNFRAPLASELDEQLNEEISDEDSDAGYVYAFTYKSIMRDEDFPIKFFFLLLAMTLLLGILDMHILCAAYLEKGVDLLLTL